MSTDQSTLPGRRLVSGRGWAYTGAILGGIVSVAANVAHSYVPPGGALAGWTPHFGAVVSAVFWPVALLVVIEIFARVDWPNLNRWVAVRWLGLVPVAVVAAVVSYRHMSGLFVYYGEDALTTRIGPLAVDGLMVMATGALIATSRARGALTHRPGVPQPQVAKDGQTVVPPSLEGTLETVAARVTEGIPEESAPTALEGIGPNVTEGTPTPEPKAPPKPRRKATQKVPPTTPAQRLAVVTKTPLEHAREIASTFLAEHGRLPGLRPYMDGMRIGETRAREYRDQINAEHEQAASDADEDTHRADREDTTKEVRA